MTAVILASDDLQDWYKHGIPKPGKQDKEEKKQGKGK